MKIKSEVAWTERNPNFSLQGIDKRFVNWISELEHRFLRIYNEYNSSWIKALEDITVLQDAVLTDQCESSQGIQDASTNCAATSPESSAKNEAAKQRERLLQILSDRRETVERHVFIRASEKATTAIRDLQSRSRSQIGFSNSSEDSIGNKVCEVCA